MSGFEIHFPSRIIFSLGSSSRLGQLAGEFGRRALVVHSPGLDAGRLAGEPLSRAGLETVFVPVEGEPTIESIQQALRLAGSRACDCVVSLGGGSAIDTGKAASVLLTNPGALLDYLEVVGSGQPLARPGLPHIAVPTTAGTGAEVTRNAVIGVPEKRVKVSLRSPHLLPSTALLDPQLATSMPPAVTAASGMDALTQLIEAFVSNQANPFSDAFCRAGVPPLARSLLRAFEDGQDVEARQDMSLAALFSGLALANARLGLVHGFAGVMGGMFGAPHGAICAALLVEVMEANIEALRSQVFQPEALERYSEIARLLTGDPGAGGSDGSAWVRRLRQELGIVSLSSLGVSAASFAEIVEKAMRASSTQGNPVQLTERQMKEVLEKAL